MKTLIDATEQPIQRPKDKRCPEFIEGKKRDAHSSGRRKRTIKKRQIAASLTRSRRSPAGLILDQFPGERREQASDAGRVHDFALFKERHGVSPPFADLLQGTTVYVDSGYQGIEDFLPARGEHA